MNKIKIGNTELKASEIILGCMRIDKLSVKDVSLLIEIAMEQGINFFDHADIYGGGNLVRRHQN